MSSNFELIERTKLKLITGGHVYDPDNVGRRDILTCGETILDVGKIDQKKLISSSLDVEVFELDGDLICPGIIDPHSHLLGGSGENGGFSSQTPEIALSEIVKSGITTVVGTLGADTTMKTMEGLLAKVKGLNDEGLSAYCYTGGYTVPPSTIMKSVSDDLMFIQEIIGMGEVAVNDERASEPTVEKLAPFVFDTHVAGNLANKAGVTHFHVGDGKLDMQCIFELLEYAPNMDPVWIYPTHIERSEKIVKKAVQLTKKGSFVDMDVVEGDLHKWLHVYTKNGGALSHLTVSSDASKTSPGNILREIVNCVKNHRYKLETLLPLITSQPAKILKFKDKGCIKKGFDASFMVLDKKSLELKHVISKGHCMYRDGKLTVREKFLQESNRFISLRGDEA